MITIIMALAKVEDKLLFGDTSGKLPWGKIVEDMKFFKECTETKKSRTFICSQSTYNTLPKVVINRLRPRIVEEVTERDYSVESEIIILGGRKLIDSALPFADHVIISEIGGITEVKDSFIFLRDETVQKLNQMRFESDLWYFNTPSFDPNKPHLKQAYALSRDRYKSS